MKFSALLVVVLSLPVYAEVTTNLTTGISRTGYLIGPGDQLKISVFDYEEYSGVHAVLPDGNITMPLIGNVRVAGRTNEDLAQELRERLRPYLKTALVTVGISSLRPLRINVAGEVMRPGPIQLRSLSDTTLNLPVRVPTVSMALSESGGVTRNADLRNVVLRRSSEALKLNLWEVLWSQELQRDPVLEDGDTLYIPRLGVGEALDRRLIARSSFAPKTIRVRVVGEVKNPGEIQIAPDSSWAGAMAAAGGATDKADLSQVFITWLDERGQVAKSTINLTELADNQQVEDGAIVVVPKSGTSVGLDFLAALLSPLGGLGSLLRGIR